jgi:hypothetical protein
MIILQLGMMKTIQSRRNELSGLCFSMIVDVRAAARKATFGTMLSPRDSCLLCVCSPRRQNWAKKKWGARRTDGCRLLGPSAKPLTTKMTCVAHVGGRRRANESIVPEAQHVQGIKHCAKTRNLLQGTLP